MITELSKILFWLCLLIVIYTWFFYPALLYLFSRFLNNSNKNKTQSYNEDEKPIVSIIVAAFNEEKVIGRRIENLLLQDYPKDKLEIVVASDGSTDRTVEIARQYEKFGVKVLDFKENRGKASVHNDAVDVAKGQILLFTDAETTFEKDFVKNGVKWLANNRYGCGAGELEFYYKDEIGRSESIYWKIEKKMRYWEFKLGILPFASGACFFIRKELYEKIPPFGDIDNLLTLITIAKGYKIFYAKDAKAHDFAIQGSKIHFRKRLRTTMRSMGDMISYLPELFKRKKIIVLWVLFSHRIFRWLTGYFMLFLFITNVLILIPPSNLFYQLIFYLQLVFYLSVFVGWYLDNKIKISLFNSFKIFKIVYSFYLANLATIIAIIKLMKGEKISSWKNKI
ncbi:MAG TPA: glycosyltransferase [Candidatus Atribacteria bacterium]|nr:glycosyltransferase [Candidatus Atribacteria bacterium]